MFFANSFHFPLHSKVLKTSSISPPDLQVYLPVLSFILSIANLRSFLLHDILEGDNDSGVDESTQEKVSV